MASLPRKVGRSLGHKLNLATVLMALLITALNGFYFRINMQEKIADQLHHEMDELASSLYLALETNTSSANLQRVISALATGDLIQHLSLFQDDLIIADNHFEHLNLEVAAVYGEDTSLRTKEVLNHKQDSVESTPSGLVLQLKLIHLISTEDMRLRPYVLYIAYDITSLQVQTRNDMIELMVIQAMGFLLLLAINTWVQGKIVLRPINRIRQQMVTNQASPIEYKSDDELGLLVESYNQLISLRLSQAKELAQSRRYIDAVTDVIPVMLAYVDNNRRYRFVNYRYLQWVSRDSQMVLGHLVTDILAPEIEQLMSPYIEQALGGEAQQFELEQNLGYGGISYFQITLVPDLDEDKKVAGFFTCIEDMTKVKSNERKIEDYAQELEFNNWALTEAREKAESAARAKADFLACMSHEIRTPMNGVLGILCLLEDTTLSSQQQHYVSIATSSASTLLSLLNDILDFSKIESGKLEIEQISFDVLKLFDDFLQPLAIRAEHKGLKLLLDVSEIHRRWVIGDPSRIRQVLMNLVGNAIKFTEIGWIAVRVRLRVESAKISRLEVRIEDTGIGISKEKMELLFNPFTQADSSTTRHFGGTGLGLSIAKRLCELMGGDVRVVSIPTLGSTFSFDLLLQTDDSVENNWPPAMLNQRVLFGGELGAYERMIMDLLDSWQMSIVSVDGNPNNAKSYQLAAGDWFIYSVPSNLSLIKDELFWLERFGCDNNLRTIALISHQQMLDLPESIGGSSHLFCRPVSITRLSEFLSGEPVVKVVNTKKITAQFHSKSRVLLVEDNKVNQLVALGMLKKIGLETVDVANNGLEGLAALQRASYDMILMDCLMPEMDGYQATSAIRAGDAGAKYKDVPIIAMTANAMKGDRELCIAAGMNDYITKPLDADSVVSILCEYLPVMGNEVMPEPLNPAEKVFDEVLFDQERAIEMLSGDTSLLQEILQVFREEMTIYRGDFENAITNRDLGGVRNAVHSIKGAAANLCMMKLAKSARELEIAAQAQDWPFIEQQKEAFLILLERTKVIAVEG